MNLTWHDSEPIAQALRLQHPEIDPLTVRFDDLAQWVTQLEGFDEATRHPSEGTLEAIQAVWYEKFRGQ